MVTVLYIIFSFNVLVIDISKENNTAYENIILIRSLILFDYYSSLAIET